MKYIRKRQKILIECYVIIRECLQQENIRNRNLLCRNLDSITEYGNILPVEDYQRIKQIVDEMIKPLIYDTDYFEFLKEGISGQVDDDFHFVLDSNSSLDEYIFKEFHHCLNLEDTLNKRFETHFNINMKEK